MNDYAIGFLTWSQVDGLLALFVISFGYNLLVAWLQHREAGDFTALQVVVGVLAILGVPLTDSRGMTLAVEQWIGLTLAHFVAAGFWMLVGSWQRRAH